MAKSKIPVRLISYEEIMGIGDYEEVVLIAIDAIHPFKNHPFKVKDDEKMQELIKSISMKGILTPVTVRVDGDGQYEMISGHRRMYAASMIGMDILPAIVKEMDDDEATIAMVNANIQREEQLPRHNDYFETRWKDFSNSVASGHIFDVAGGKSNDCNLRIMLWHIRNCSCCSNDFVLGVSGMGECDCIDCDCSHRICSVVCEDESRRTRGCAWTDGSNVR